MYQPVIEVNNLSFAYGKHQVLANCHLKVPQGALYGLLGHNGAGKTTLIKIILGLIQQPSHVVALFGQPMQHPAQHLLGRVGAFIESPSPYPQMTCRNYLRLKQVSLGLPPTVVDEYLELVGLLPHANKKARYLSLGMRQRLALAFALVNDPELLILDEPTNGLDPAGILEVRQLLHQLVQQHGKTILVSSHQLAEVEKTVSHLGILHQGKLLFEGPIGQLTNSLQQTVAFGVDNMGAALGCLNDAGYNASANGHSQDITVEVNGQQQIMHINRLLHQHHIGVYAINSTLPDLEAIFLAMTSTNTPPKHHAHALDTTT